MAGVTPLTPCAPVVPLQHGIIFFAHGSRDPLWSQPIEAVAQAMLRKRPQALGLCAYLELTPPDLASATAQLVAQGCQHITILPMFLGTGRHARHDLPVLVQAMAQTYPELRFDIATAVGEDPRVTDLLAQIALEYAI